MPRPAILNFLHLICFLSPKITPALACDKYLQGLVMERDTSVGVAVWLILRRITIFYVSFIPVPHHRSSQLEHMNIYNKLNVHSFFLFPHTL